MNASLPKLLLSESQAVAGIDKPVGNVPHITIGAFSETSELDGVIAEAGQDRRLSRAITATSMGGIPGAIDYCRTHPTPDLLLLESGDSGDTLVAQLSELAELCDRDTKVVVIGKSNDVSLYRDLMDRGISDYIVGPVDILTVIATVLRLFEKPGAAKTGRIFAFIGAKGGVGSSVIAQNLGWNIAERQERPVLLADMDLQFGSAALNLNLESATCFADQLGNSGRKGDTARLDQALFERLLAHRGKFLNVLPAGSTAREVPEPGSEMMDRLFDLAQGSFSFVVLDVPHAWTPWVRQALSAADEIILTAEPDLGNLSNAKRLIEMLRPMRPHDAPPRLVLNKVGTPSRSEIKATEFAAALQLEAVATFGFDPKLFSKAANGGQLLTETSIRNMTRLPFANLEKVLTERKSEAAPPKAPGFFAHLFGLTARTG